MNQSEIKHPKPNRFVYLSLFVFLTGVFVLVAMLNLREPWSDEAMLAYNIFSTKVSVFRPLPHYEQAAPIGYILAIRASITGLEPLDALNAMRIVSLSAFSLGILLLSLTFLETRKWVAAVIFFAIIFMNGWIWQYAVEIKHYSFEFLATCLIILSGKWLASTHRAAAAITFFVASALATLIAFTSPLVVVATTMSVLFLAIFSKKCQIDSPKSHHQKKFVGATAVISILTVIVIHFLVNRELAHFQFMAYHEHYDHGLVNFKGSAVENIKILSLLPEYALQSLGQSSIKHWLSGQVADSFALYASIAVVSFLVLSSILFLAFNIQPFIVVTAIMILILAAFLNIAGMLPISSHRHFFFLSPLILVCSAFAGQRLYSLLSSHMNTRFRRPINLLGLLILAFLSTIGAQKTLTNRSPEILPVLAEITKSDETARIWLYPSVQPMSLIVAPESFDLLGILDNHSTDISWEERGFLRSDDGTILRRDYIHSIGKAAVNREPLWLIFPIIVGFEVDDYILEVEASDKSCEMRLRTNGTELYYCA